MLHDAQAKREAEVEHEKTVAKLRADYKKSEHTLEDLRGASKKKADKVKQADDSFAAAEREKNKHIKEHDARANAFKKLLDSRPVAIPSPDAPSSSLIADVAARRISAVTHIDTSARQASMAEYQKNATLDKIRDAAGSLFDAYEPTDMITLLGLVENIVENFKPACT